MKKGSLILTISLLLFSIFSIKTKALNNDTVIINGNTINNYEGESFHHFLNGTYDSYEYVDYKMDVRWFFDDLTKYNSDLAKLTLMISVNTFVNSEMDVYEKGHKPGTSLEEQRQYMKSYMSNLGFTNIIDYSLDEDYDDHDLSEVFIGTMKVTYDGSSKNIIGVFIRGTNGTYAEWASNLDIGDKSKFDKYEDWTDIDNFKGYDVPCNRILEKLNEYITNSGLKDNPNNLYWATGYSRSGPIANLLGAKLIDKGKNVVTYTFASPAATIKSTNIVTNPKYNSLFNVNNSDDFVPSFPNVSWGSNDTGYKLYGIQKEVAASSLRANGYLKKNAEESIQYGVPVDTATAIQNAVAEMFKGVDARVEAYKVYEKPLFIFNDLTTYTVFLSQLSGEYKDEFSKLTKETLEDNRIAVYGSMMNYANGLAWVMSAPKGEDTKRYFTFYQMGIYLNEDNEFTKIRNFHSALIKYANFAPSCHVPTTYYEILRKLNNEKSYPYMKVDGTKEYVYNGEKQKLTFFTQVIGKDGTSLEVTPQLKIYSDLELTSEVNEIKNVGEYYIVYNFLGNNDYAPISSIPIKIKVNEPSNWNFKEQVNIADDAPYIDFKDNVSVTKYIDIVDPEYKNVVLELNENIEKDTNKINKIKSNYTGYNVADILNITLNLKYEKDGSQSKSITNLNNDIELVIDMSYLDEVSEGNTREFKVVSLHDNYISVLPSSYNSSNGELTFKTNRFSTFGILYRDKNDNPNSCENTYGPTWHWNNKKGICEDSGSVKTNIK